jgi:hypothetical protein
VPVPQLAAILGSRLGPNWGATPPPHVDLQGADRLTTYVARQHVRPVLAAPASPRGYLTWLLDVTFAGDEEPPEQSRAHIEHRHQAVLGQAAAAAAAHEQLHAGFDQVTAAAAQTSNGRIAALAAAKAARGPARHRQVPAVDPDRLAAAAAELAAHQALDEQAWPTPRQPGAGLPPHWHHGDDR